MACEGQAEWSKKSGWDALASIGRDASASFRAGSRSMISSRGDHLPAAWYNRVAPKGITGFTTGLYLWCNRVNRRAGEQKVSETDQTDQIRQWGIKAIPARVVDEISEAARTSVPKLTTGQLIEKVWDHWKYGAEVAPSPTMEMPTPDEVAVLTHAACELSDAPDTMAVGVRAKLSQLHKVSALWLLYRAKSVTGLGKATPTKIATLVQVAAAEQRSIAAE